MHSAAEHPPTRRLDARNTHLTASSDCSRVGSCSFCVITGGVVNDQKRLASCVAVGDVEVLSIAKFVREPHSIIRTPLLTPFRSFLFVYRTHMTERETSSCLSICLSVCLSAQNFKATVDQCLLSKLLEKTEVATKANEADANSASTKARANALSSVVEEGGGGGAAAAEGVRGGVRSESFTLISRKDMRAAVAQML